MIDPLIAVRTVHLASTAMAGGVVFFRLWAAGPAVRRAGAGLPSVAWLDARLDRIAWGSLALVVVSAAAWLMLVASDMSGRPFGDVLHGGVIPTVLTGTRFGHVWIARLAVALMLAVCLPRSRLHGPSCAGRSVAAVLAAALLGGLALAGHGGATAGPSGAVHLASDIAHAVAAGAWVGGLVPLALLFAAARRAGDSVALAAARDATRRFSTLGLLSVGTLLATGIVNTIFLVGSVPALFGTAYGQLLSVKILLFAAMVGIAAVNRLKLTPALAQAGAADALRRLQRNSLAEALLGLAVLVIVGALGTIPPALHVEPWWPLPFRLDEGAFTAPDLRLNAILAAAATAALVAAATAACFRRWRRPAVVLGAIALACLAWNLRFVAVTAFPTSFYQSPTHFTVASIARGQELFAAHCAGCHGNAGRGTGPNALALDMETSDLTADHVYDHPDGDLFWWIGHGIDETMPGFAAAIDDGARWNLIDFIHANADAARLQRGGHDGLNAFPAPSLTAECPDGSAVALEDLRGRFVRLVVTNAGSIPRASRVPAHDDIATIMAPVDRTDGEAAGACTVHDPDAVAALAIYRGGNTSALAGTQFLIDADGRLRAMWHPGLAPDWNDPAALDREIEALRGTQAVERPARPRGHAH